METAIDRLNKTVDERDKMIYFILSEKKPTGSDWDRMENRLSGYSYQGLKKLYEQLKNK